MGPGMFVKDLPETWAVYEYVRNPIVAYWMCHTSRGIQEAIHQILLQVVEFRGVDRSDLVRRNWVVLFATNICVHACARNTLDDVRSIALHNIQTMHTGLYSTEYSGFYNSAIPCSVYTCSVYAYSVYAANTAT